LGRVKTEKMKNQPFYGTQNKGLVNPPHCYYSSYAYA